MKWKKLILSLLAACVAALGLGALAACGEPAYYHLYFAGANGVRYETEMRLPSGEEFVSGAEVREGYEVRFSVVLVEGATGDPVVYANDTQLEPDADGVYSFTMQEETTVSVSGVSAPSEQAVVFDKGNNTVWFYDKDGNELTTLENVSEGEEVVFSVRVSVYYASHETGDFLVVANTTPLTKGSDGYYHLTVHGGTTVSVREIDEEGNVVATLAMAENFTERGDGDGSAANPFKLRVPCDLYMMSYLVNSSTYTGYNEAHYELAADIDLEGEQLYIIGDGSSSTAVFGGTFNGNGHTISDYTITSTYYNIDNAAEMLVTNVGVFGIAMPLSQGAPEIYNLNLDGFVIDADCSGAGDSIVNVGGIVGYGIGVNIVGCSARGELTALASANGTFGYIGGIIGLLQSAYDAATQTSSFSSVRSSWSDVEVTGLNYVMAAGGVAGAVLSYEASTTAFVLNSYALGSVGGAIRSGGVVGMLFANGSVLSSYATGTVEAISNFTDDYQSPEFAHAYAGGVVGYAENDTIVADCFAAGDAYVQASSGTGYAHKGEVLGGGIADSALPSYDSKTPIVRNSVHTDSVSVTNSYIQDMLGWDAEDWTFGDGYPTVNHEETSKTFTITLNFGTKQVNGASTQEIEASAYISMSYWYLFMQGNNVPQFVTAADGIRSYGYFFDTAFGEKVPNSYVPTHDVTLYAAFADYSAVAGTYYLRGTQDRAKGISLTLGADGTLVYRNGAMTNTSYYYFDGTEATLVNTIVGIHGALPEGQADYNYANFRAVLGEHGLLSVSDKVYFASQPLTAQKEFDNFFYGEYNMGTASYTFYRDGTGVRTPASSNAEAFEYYVERTTLTLTMSGGNTRTGTVGADGQVASVQDDTKVSVKDEFAGTWERYANAHETYTFDGANGWEYLRYDLTGGTRHEVASEEGTYTIEGTDTRYAKFTRGGVEYHAYFENGVLCVEATDGSVLHSYYREGSYAGTWLFKNGREQIRITLSGIGEDGVGNASVAYIGQSTGSYELKYETAGRQLRFYLEDMSFGVLTLNEGNYTLNGTFYSNRGGALRSDTTFILYDELRGAWISAQEGFELVEFNGEGSYELTGNAEYLAVRGTVSIGGTIVGYYTLENGTMKGSFVYKSVTYTIEYSEDEPCVHVTYEGGSFDLMTRDEWYGVELVDETGRTYAFDGRGKLAGGGTISSYSQGYSNYSYTVEEDGSVSFHSTAGNVNGTISVKENAYKVVFNGVTRTAELNAGFKGTWLISAAYGDLVIGAIGPSGTATGSIALEGEPEDVTFTYHADGNYLDFVRGGVTYYVHIANNRTELTVSTTNAFGGVVCIQKSLTDEFYGEFTTADGSAIHFDGLGKSVYSDGTAYTTDANGNTLRRYYYSVDDKGVPALRLYGSYSSSAGQLFVLSENGEYSKEGAEEKYTFVEPDDAYNGKVLVYEEVEYYFDGMGHAFRDGETYSYTCEIVGGTRLVVTIAFSATEKETVTITATGSGAWVISSVETGAAE